LYDAIKKKTDARIHINISAPYGLRSPDLNPREVKDDLYAIINSYLIVQIAMP